MLDGLFRRRRLPHWDVEDATYFVTACLAGSIPARGLVHLQSFREEVECRSRLNGLSLEEWELHKHKLLFAQFDYIIDVEPAVRHLANPIAAAQVESCLRHFAGKRYDLLAFVVMPSHFHWVFHPRAEWVQACVDERRQAGKPTSRPPRQLVMKSVKVFVSRVQPSARSQGPVLAR